MVEIKIESLDRGYSILIGDEKDGIRVSGFTNISDAGGWVISYLREVFQMAADNKLRKEIAGAMILDQGEKGKKQ